MIAASTALPVGRQADAEMPVRRIVRAYVTEAKYESLRMLRAPSFSIPFLLLPVPIYLFFGVMLSGSATAKNPALANYLFSGFSVFAVMGPALFGVGCGLAVEREAGFLKLKRALPAPAGAFIVAKMLMSMVFAAAATIMLVIAALMAGKISLSGGQLVIMTIVMTVGALPFCAMGLFLGAHASGSAAPGLANAVFLPMLYLSGLFIPLPKLLERWVVIWPSFHVNQVALGLAGISEFSFVAPAISAAVLAGVTVVFGGLAIRRLAVRG